MKQIDNKIYENGKYLELKTIYKNYNILKNAWDERSNIRGIPSIFVIKGKINDVIDYDINPLGNTKIKNKCEMGNEIEKFVKDFLVKEPSCEIGIGISGRFKVKPTDSTKVAEMIYDILMKYIK